MSTTFISHIATVEIPVSNLDRSIEFYCKVLGVNIEYRGKDSAMLSFNETGAPTIYLVETKEFESLSFKNVKNGVIHSVVDFYTPLLNDFYHWLKEHHVEVGALNINPKNGLGGFGFKDPDGTVLGATNILGQAQ